jgi:hypothetical protein
MVPTHEWCVIPKQKTHSLQKEIPMQLRLQPSRVCPADLLPSHDGRSVGVRSVSMR